MGSGLKERVLQIFKYFLTRVAKLEELAAIGSRLLCGFQQGLEFLRRPPINRNSELIEKIIKANETERVKLYMVVGCINNHDRLQNINKSKSVLGEFENLLDDLATVIRTASGSVSTLGNEDLCERFDPQITINQDDISSSDPRELEMTDYAALVASIYSMVKLDYDMQERIVTSLNLKSLSEELESYCQMWSLRPFVNDEIMRQAWKLIN